MQRFKVALRFALMTVGIVLAVAAIGYVWLWLESSDVESERSEVATESELATTVGLPPNKLKAAELSTAAAEQRLIARSATLMGRIDYDRTRFLAINAFDDLVVEQLPVQVGEPISADETVMVAQCPALGKARAEVIRQAALCELTRTERDRIERIDGGLQRLLTFVAQDMAVAQVQQQIAQESLGPYRQQVIDAYSDASLAKSLLEQGQQAVEQGALAGRSLQERQAAWQSAQSRLLSVCEDSRFEVSQELGKIQSQLDEQEAQLAIQVEFLKYLIGATEIDVEALRAMPKDQLGRWEIKTPRTGVVVKLPVALGARLQHEDRLVELADPSKVWVRAWWRPAVGEVVAIDKGTEVVVSRPESDDEAARAKVIYTAAGFDEQSAAMPIVAELDNQQGQYRAGQLVQVSVPLEEEQQLLTVPASSVCEHEGLTFVFVPRGEGKFERRDVQIAWSQGPWAVVSSGLTAGTEVVSENAFYLKSELLLEAEE